MHLLDSGRTAEIHSRTSRRAKPLSKDFVQTPASAVHANLDASLFKRANERTTREVAALIRIGYVRYAEATICHEVQRVMERLQHKAVLQTVAELPRDNVAAIPIDEGNEIDKALGGPNVCDVCAPDVVRTVSRHATQEVRIDGVPRGCLTGIWLRVDRFQPEHVHEVSNPLTTNADIM